MKLLADTEPPYDINKARRSAIALEGTEGCDSERSVGQYHTHGGQRLNVHSTHGSIAIFRWNLLTTRTLLINMKIVASLR
jgi:hypothetical protein